MLRRLNPNEISDFYSQIAIMLTSGVPLSEAISSFCDQRDSRKIRNRACLIKKKLASGLPLEKCLEEYPELFNSVLVKVLASNISDEDKKQVLIKFSEKAARFQKARGKVKEILYYPGFVLCVLLFVLFVLLVFVIPVFSEMFANFGSSLPYPTLLVISASDMMVGNFFYIVSLFAALAVFFRFNKKLLFKIISLIPFFGIIVKQNTILTFSESLSLMLLTRTSFVESLQSAVQSVTNPYYRDVLLGIADKTSDIVTFKKEIIGCGLFPPMVLKSLETSKQSEDVYLIMEAVSAYYSKSFVHQLENKSERIESFVILFTGIIVGSLIISMYLPIFMMAGSI
ncbi:MAG: type II secretion system F family protein [Proteobacteria bacterium]|nr:type II secretion system F family protein [Pseudomonadota bacterium]MBU1584316.1 type II secretion system F family protein [Pseudomonadota bacterium]MBU2451859.1 type II secretion system F family protein [Pseudomonadota bacterium]MBU2628693.1 type II secretion system F family protein [Pseudomonadota bacterium]